MVVSWWTEVGKILYLKSQTDRHMLWESKTRLSVFKTFSSNELIQSYFNFWVGEIKRFWAGIMKPVQVLIFENGHLPVEHLLLDIIWIKFFLVRTFWIILISVKELLSGFGIKFECFRRRFFKTFPRVEIVKESRAASGWWIIWILHFDIRTVGQVYGILQNKITIEKNVLEKLSTAKKSSPKTSTSSSHQKVHQNTKWLKGTCWSCGEGTFWMLAIFPSVKNHFQ